MLIYIFIITATFLGLRLIYLLRCANRIPPLSCRNMPAKTMIVLGSGGHTTEMLCIVKQLNKSKYWPRIYLSATSDTTSDNKIHEIEHNKQNDYEIHKIYRSRTVHQSYTTSIFTTMYSVLTTIPLMLRIRPQLILTNGPGTCVPICFVAFLFKLLCINNDCRIVFVESYCRVQTLSLTGKILLWITDLFVVQWKHLIRYSSKVRYFGRLS